MKETDDMRAPLAFLLGRLHFDDDFKQITISPDPRTDNVFVTATPKSDKLPYTQVSFLVSPRLGDPLAVGEGAGWIDLEYVFENEKKNPRGQESMFHFVLPPGVEYVDSSRP